MFSLKPRPKTVVYVCDDIACMCAGADELCADLDKTVASAGEPFAKGEAAWVFCVLVPGVAADEDQVRALVAAELGKAFAPERVLFVPALPKTRSAKIVRRAVRATALGRDPGDMSSVENPEALEAIAAAVG